MGDGINISDVYDHFDHSFGDHPLLNLTKIPFIEHLKLHLLIENIKIIIIKIKNVKHSVL